MESYCYFLLHTFCFAFFSFKLSRKGLLINSENYKLQKAHNSDKKICIEVLFSLPSERENIFKFLYFRDRVLLCLQAGVQWCDRSSWQSWTTKLKPSSHFSLWSSCTPPHWLIFIFLVEMGFCHVDQASLELLTSASQSAGITGMSHCDFKCSLIIM